MFEYAPPLQPNLPRAHNDDGDRGLCTFCGGLHTVTIVPACAICKSPVRTRTDELCDECADIVYKVENA